MKDFEQKVRQEKSAEEAEKEIARKKRQVEIDLENVDWDLWLGPAKFREYFPGCYHPFAWRGWWDFGTGALGDIACHSLNSYMAGLDLGAPKSVVAETSGHDFDIFPKWSIIEFEYPDTETRKGFKFVWYDGGKIPPATLMEELGLQPIDPKSMAGSLIIGTDGVRGPGRNTRKEGVVVPEFRSAPKYPGPDGQPAEKQEDDPRNVFELITAIKENNPDLCFSNFPKQAGPLTEAMLLGNLAVWTASKPGGQGEKVYWDAANMKITNLADLKTPGVADLIKPVYRDGYFLE